VRAERRNRARIRALLFSDYARQWRAALCPVRSAPSADGRRLTGGV